MATRACYACQQTGHYADRCPTRAVKAKKVQCYKCRQFGHYSDKCVAAPQEDKKSDASTCVICLCEPRGALLKPCNHVCACLECSRQLTQCPVCRADIWQRERIFIS